MRPRRFAPAVLTFGLAGCTVEAPTPPIPAATATAAAPAPVVPQAPAGSEDGGAAPPPLLAAKPKAVDVEAALLRANRALEIGNLPTAVKSYEEVLRAEPENRQALGSLAKAAHGLAQSVGRPASSPLYLKSAHAFRRLLKVDPNLNAEEKNLLPIALYNAACTMAISGDAPTAMATLVESFEAGFPRIDIIDTDPELEGLRRLPEFRAFQEKVEAQHVKNLLTTTPHFSFDFTLPDLDGKPRSLAELKGEVTIVDIWGTWCVPCRKEVPHLVDLARRYADRGLKVVGINYEKADGAEARAAVRAFLKEYGVEYACVVGDQATLDRVPNFEGYPTTLFIDREGTVRLKLTGYQSKIALEKALNALLDKPTATETPAAGTGE